MACAHGLVRTALVLLAVAPFGPARAQDADVTAQRRIAAWQEGLFTCRDLNAADAGKDSDDEARGNYNTIMAWVADFPGMAGHKDLETRARLADDVVRWCADLARSGGGSERLTSVVDKAWRMSGN